jgi:hypothetical protein
VAEVGGEAVAGVDHGGREFVLTEISREGNAGIRVEVSRMHAWAKLLSGAKFLERSHGGAEGSACINKVAGACTRAEDGFAFWDAANNDDIGEDAVSRLRGVASSEGDRVAARESEESADEFVGPALRKIGRKREREEGCAGDPSHGGDVAEAASEATVSDGIRRMPLTAEVNALEREVCCNQHLVAVRDVNNRAVITDAVAGVCVAASGGSADSLDELEFGQRHV